MMNRARGAGQDKLGKVVSTELDPSAFFFLLLLLFFPFFFFYFFLLFLSTCYSGDLMVQSHSALSVCLSVGCGACIESAISSDGRQSRQSGPSQIRRGLHHRKRGSRSGLWGLEKHMSATGGPCAVTAQSAAFRIRIQQPTCCGCKHCALFPVS